MIILMLMSLLGSIHVGATRANNSSVSGADVPREDCASPDSYRRLTGREIEEAVGDNLISYDWAQSAIYRGIAQERFDRRRNRYEVQYDVARGGGTWETAGDRLCTREHGEPALCRQMFRSEGCGYSFSEPDGDQPLYRARISD